MLSMQDHKSGWLRSDDNFNNAQYAPSFIKYPRLLPPFAFLTASENILTELLYQAGNAEVKYILHRSALLY